MKRAERTPADGEARAAHALEDLAQAKALLADDRAALLLAQPFVGHLAMHLDIAVGAFEQAMAVDGRSLFFDAARVLALSEVERRFLLAHGVWHCALLHPFRRDGRDQECWDRAADAEVNGILAKDWPIPESVAHLPAEGRSADQICAALDPGKLEPRGPLADAHWPPPAEQVLEGEWLDRIRLAMQGAEQSGDDVPGAVAKLVSARGRAVTPWRTLLRTFVTDASGDVRTWLPPNRRHVHRGLFLPSRRTPQLHFAVLLDTSASTEPVQPAFLGELAEILRSLPSYELLILQGDARVQDEARFDSRHPFVPTAVRLQGFGGTSFIPAFERVEKETPPPSVFIVFTDGEGTPPTRPPSFPVIWALSPGGSAPVPWGHRVPLELDRKEARA
jgi:predicted metal-dependent peptidase